jgi:Flp pilus assembly protein TadG
MRFNDLKRRLRRAGKDEGGGILVTAALSMLPITMLAFAAVEFHNFTRHKAELQDAVDAAALAVARAPNTATHAELRALYLTVLRGHLQLRPGALTLVEAPGDASGAGQQPSLTISNGRVTAEARVAIAPIIASMFIEGDVVASGSSEVVREAKGLEVALVLDNTGSMATNNRIGIAKTAATNFVNSLEQATSGTTTPNSVRIGLVPFAGTVNVGSTHQNASWIDASGANPTSREIFTTINGVQLTTGTNRFTLLSQMGIPWGGCVESRPHPHDVNDTAPSAANPSTLFVPYFAPDEPDYLPPGAPANFHSSNNWNSTRGLQLLDVGNSYVWDLKRYVTNGSKSGNDQFIRGRLGEWSYLIDFSAPAPGYIDRLKGWMSNGNTSAATHIGALGTTDKYRSSEFEPGFTAGSTTLGPNQGCDVRPLTRLTNNYAALRTAINNMTPAGPTNIPMGLVWGWHLLSPNAPFSDGSAYGTANMTKVAVLMTDGDNAIDGLDYTGVGYAFQNRLGTTSIDPATLTGALNSRMAQLCTNMKASGIVIYTIRVEQTTGDPAHMRNCASDADKFFDVASASALDATFREIARSIQKLRISV